MICSAEPRIILCLPTHVINLVINDNSLEILYLFSLLSDALSTLIIKLHKLKKKKKRKEITQASETVIILKKPHRFSYRNQSQTCHLKPNDNESYMIHICKAC